jgi:hypothetical protein
LTTALGHPSASLPVIVVRGGLRSKIEFGFPMSGKPGAAIESTLWLKDHVGGSALERPKKAAEPGGSAALDKDPVIASE